eukprot:1701553-Prymnesium_polylepis.1
MGQLCKDGWGNCDMRFRTYLYTSLYKTRLRVMCNASETVVLCTRTSGFAGGVWELDVGRRARMGARGL